MGWQDRDYNRDDTTTSAFGGRLRGSSVVMVLLIINVIVFLLDGILYKSQRAGALSPENWGHFSVEKGIRQFQLWRWITYQFLHSSFFHIFGNMLGLYFFGPILERWWGGRRFLAFYLVSGIGAALFLLILMMIPGLLNTSSETRLLGASGSVFGVLIGAAMVAPKQPVRLLLLPIEMQIRTLALVFLGIAVLSVLVGARNAGGEAAHLGGAAIGFLLMKFPRTLGFAEGIGGKLADWKRNRLRAAAQREQAQSAKLDAEVDRILAKVKEHGLQSLTDKEKKTLQTATDRQRRSA